MSVNLCVNVDAHMLWYTGGEQRTTVAVRHHFLPSLRQDAYCSFLIAFIRLAHPQASGDSCFYPPCVQSIDVLELHARNYCFNINSRDLN